MKQLFTTLLSLSLLAVSLPTQALTEDQTISTRIVGGIESAPTQWQSIVSVKYKGYKNTHFCGGSLIAEQWVLTAAHCMFENGLPLSASELVATVGEYDLNSSPVTPSTNIEQIFTHPDYDPSKQENDIALLKLSEPVTNDSVTIVSLLSTASLVAQQRPATVMGWGSTIGYDPDQIVDPYYPDLLREVEVPLNTDQQCASSLGSSYTNVMICAGLPEGGKDSCQGDSGGPLMVNTNYGWQQLGLVSWGYGCASAGSPGVYTRIALFADWIESITSTFSITASTNFLTTSVDSSDSKQITVDNNSDSVTSFTYEIAGSDYFSFDASDCTTIDAHSSCQFPVTYAPLDLNLHKATITVSSSIAGSAAQESKLSGVPFILDDVVSSSSGSLGFYIWLLVPLVFVRRYYP